MSISTPAFATTTAAVASDQSGTQVAAQNDPFADVSPTSWAYRAVLQLRADGLIEGYPDGYFHGNRTLTRYEMAVLTQRAVDKLESDMTDASKATKVNSDDIALVRKLLDAYGSDLAAVKKQLAATEAQSNKNAAELKRANVHVSIFARPGLFGERSSVVDGFGKSAKTGPALYGTTFAVQGNGAALSNANLRQDGSTTHGTGYQFVRFGIDGELSDQLSYETEFENVLTYDSIASTSNANNNFVRLNTASLKYATPTGWTFTGGRFLAENSPLGLLYDDYFNGLEAGYAHDRYSANLGYSFNAAGGTNAANYSALTNGAVTAPSSQTLFAHAQYEFSKKVSGGISYSSDVFPAAGLAGASAYSNNAVTGIGQELFVGQAAQTAGSLNAEVKVNKKFEVQGELARHFGKNPNTGQQYVQPMSFWAQALYGNTTPIQNHNYAEAGFIVSGVNGLSAHNSTFGLGDDYQSFYAGSLDGYHLAYVGAHHYLANNASVGLVYQRYALNAGVALPAAAIYGTVPGAAAGGTFLSHDQGQALFLETKLQF